MPTKVYICKYCGEPFEDYDEALTHETSCDHNPKLKHCARCCHCKIWDEHVYCDRGMYEHFHIDAKATICPEYTTLSVKITDCNGIYMYEIIRK
jgi:hypothetical protein